MRVDMPTWTMLYTIITPLSEYGSALFAMNPRSRTTISKYATCPPMRTGQETRKLYSGKKHSDSLMLQSVAGTKTSWSSEEMSIASIAFVLIPDSMEWRKMRSE